MNEFLIAGGWKLYDQCHCGGKFTQKFNHPLVKIRIYIYPKQGKFNAYNFNNIVKQGDFESLKVFIQEIFTPAQES